MEINSLNLPHQYQIFIKIFLYTCIQTLTEIVRNFPLNTVQRHLPPSRIHCPRCHMRLLGNLARSMSRVSSSASEKDNWSFLKPRPGCFPGPLLRWGQRKVCSKAALKLSNMQTEKYKIKTFLPTGRKLVIEPVCLIFRTNLVLRFPVECLKY